jgi:hypothetical protein
MMAQVNGNGTVQTVVSVVSRDENGVYIPARALELISELAPILNMFLSGQMREAEEKAKNGDPLSETLYYTMGMKAQVPQTLSYFDTVYSVRRTVPH